jgi:hypothetical protein
MREGRYDNHKKEVTTMVHYFKGMIIVLGMTLGLGLSIPGGTQGNEKKDMGGWEIDGAYNKHYDPAEFESFKGVVVKIKEMAPMRGMSPGVILWVRERIDEEVYRVDLCPVWFAKARDTGIRKGEKVHVKGVFTEINGEDVFMASKIKKGEWEFKVRLTKDGTPFWTMSPEQLAQERSAN